MSKLFVNTIAPNSGDTVTVSGSLTTTGKLIIGDSTSDTVAITAEVSSSLLPDATATYDLGTMAKAWRNLHVHGLGHIHTASINRLTVVNNVSGNLIPDTGATYALGTMANSWGSAHIHGLAHIHTASLNFVSSNLLPTSDNSLDLGGTGSEWKNLYIDGTAFIDSASIDALSSSLIPITDDSLDLGSNSKQWRNLFIDGTADIDTLFALTITASGNVSSSGTVIANAFNIGKSTAASQDLNTSAEYSVNGSKVEVRAITAAQINDGTFATFKLLNTSIATDSLIHGAFTGNHSLSNMSGSIISVATIAAKTASVFIHNETGGAIAADTPFTASFIVL